ncbi:hypothetical protein L615_007500000100 [Nocardioides sp. J9]|uniref:hypothetical protein n=1 Tax=unclassified Nocardioides TaxID=2615069 RepID=UPI00048CA43C|nr:MULTISPECIES: hypothetical protein [unclassified Nocardioides]TWG92000.1 hypothetical protein L615_007500000100 [Nocardioides sp. J9]
MDLDDLLDRSAPSVTPPSAELENDLGAMVRASAPRGPGRRPIRVLVGTGVTAGLLGLGAVGAAAAINGGVPWFTSTGSGESCELEFDVRPVGPEGAASGELAAVMAGRTAWPSLEEQQEVAVAARDYLAAYDFDAVDREAAVQDADAAQRRVRAEAAPEEAQQLLTGDDLEMHAVSRKVVADLTAHLESRGMDPHVIVSTVGSTGGCAE